MPGNVMVSKEALIAGGVIGALALKMALSKSSAELSDDALDKSAAAVDHLRDAVDAANRAKEAKDVGEDAKNDSDGEKGKPDPNLPPVVPVEPGDPEPPTPAPRAEAVIAAFIRDSETRIATATEAWRLERERKSINEYVELYPSERSALLDRITARAEQIQQRAKDDEAAEFLKANRSAYDGYVSKCKEIGLDAMSFDPTNLDENVVFWTGEMDKVNNLKDQADAAVKAVSDNIASMQVPPRPALPRAITYDSTAGKYVQSIEAFLGSKVDDPLRARLDALQSSITENAENRRRFVSNRETNQELLRRLRLTGVQAQGEGLLPGMQREYAGSGLEQAWDVLMAGLTALPGALVAVMWDIRMKLPEMSQKRADLELDIAKTQNEINRLTGILDQQESEYLSLGPEVAEKNAAVAEIIANSQAMGEMNNRLVYWKGNNESNILTYDDLRGSTDMEFVRWLRAFYAEERRLWDLDRGDVAAALNEYVATATGYWTARFTVELPGVAANIIALKADEQVAKSKAIAQTYSALTIRKKIADMNAQMPAYQKLVALGLDKLKAWADATALASRIADERSFARHKYYEMARISYSYEWMATRPAHAGMMPALRAKLASGNNVELLLKRPQDYKEQQFMSKATEINTWLCQVTGGSTGVQDVFLMSVKTPPQDVPFDQRFDPLPSGTVIGSGTTINFMQKTGTWNSDLQSGDKLGEVFTDSSGKLMQKVYRPTESCVSASSDPATAYRDSFNSGYTLTPPVGWDGEGTLDYSNNWNISGSRLFKDIMGYTASRWSPIDGAKIDAANAESAAMAASRAVADQQSVIASQPAADFTAPATEADRPRPAITVATPSQPAPEDPAALAAAVAALPDTPAGYICPVAWDAKSKRDMESMLRDWPIDSPQQPGTSRKLTKVGGADTFGVNLCYFPLPPSIEWEIKMDGACSGYSKYYSGNTAQPVGDVVISSLVTVPTSVMDAPRDYRLNVPNKGAGGPDHVLAGYVASSASVARAKKAEDVAQGKTLADNVTFTFTPSRNYDGGVVDVVLLLRRYAVAPGGQVGSIDRVELGRKRIEYGGAGASVIFPLFAISKTDADAAFFDIVIEDIRGNIIAADATGAFYLLTMR